MAQNIYHGESTVVLPTTKHNRPKPPPVIPLHGLDTMAVPVHIEIRHFFHAPEDSIRSVVDKLKDSLAEALELYFPVAGTVVTNEKAEIFIATDPTNIRGAPFMVEIKDLPFEQETEDLSPRGGITFLPPSSPTFAVKLSKFSCGSLIMAASIHHQVTDLRGYLDFVECWARLARGVVIDLTKVPTNWLHTPMKYFDGLYSEAGVPTPPPGYSVLPYCPTELPAFATSEVTYWNFKKQNVEKLKNDFSMSASASDRWISSGDALASLCWGAVTRARRNGGIPRSPMSNPEHDRLAMAADGRERAPRGDMVDGSYYGNFNLLITFLVPRDDLLLPTTDAGSRVALAVRQAIGDQLNPTAIAHKIAFYEAVENNKPVGQIIWFGDVIMTNWCKFDLAGPNVDFGWGKPFRATAGGDAYPPGFVRMLQDRSSGDVLVLVTVETLAIEYLKADPLLRRYGISV